MAAGGSAAIENQTASTFSNVDSENALIGTLASGSNSVELLVDYSNFANFVTFNSAESYVTITADQILNRYPDGGTANDLQLFLDSLDGYQMYFLGLWPSRTGHLRFNPVSASSYIRVDDFGVQDGIAKTSLTSPGTGSISVQGWIDSPALTGSDDVYVVLQKQRSNGDGYTVFLSGSSAHFQVISGSTTSTVSASLTQMPSFFAAVLDRSSVTGTISLYVGTTGTYPALHESITGILGPRFDLASGSFYIGSGSVSGKTVRPFTGSLDAVSIWGVARTLHDMSGTYNRKIYAQSGLIGLWRFNDASQSTPSDVSSIVRDSSGHRLDGRIQGFFPQIRASGSIDADSPDPILSLADPDVVDYVVEAQASGTTYDRSNGSLIFNLFPEAFSVGGPTSGDIFRNFALIMARHYDRIKLYISQLPNLRRVKYGDFDQAPDELLEEVGRFMGWDLQGSFATTDALRYFVGRNVQSGPAGNAGLDTKLSEVKAAFWRRVLLNLMYMYKTKGTREAVEALLRAYGVNSNSFIRLKEYARKSEVGLPTVRVVAEKSVYAIRFSSGSSVTFIGR